MKSGDIVYLFQDRRPLPHAAYKAEVTQVMESGRFRIKNLDSTGLFEGERFASDGSVRGWISLYWGPGDDRLAAKAYQEIRERMEREGESCGP